MVSLGFELQLQKDQIQDLQRSLESLSTKQTELQKDQKSILEEIQKLKPTMHLNFPVFHGGKDNALDWVSLAERYFKFLETPEEKKVEIASLHLQGTATPWMDWYESKHKSGSWEHFVFVFLNSFGPPGLGYLDFNGSLDRLKQKGTLEEFEAEFLRLSCKASPVWTEEDFIKCFLNGLKEKRVRDLVKSLGPDSLYNAMDMARFVKAGGGYPLFISP